MSAIELFAAALWVACGIAAYGFHVGDMLGKYPRHADPVEERIVAIIYIPGGPLALAGIFFSTWETRGRPLMYGWRL